MPDYPKQEHRDYIELRANASVSARSGIEYLDIVDDSDRRQYRPGFEEIKTRRIERLPVHFQVIERCLFAKSDAELMAMLNDFLDDKFTDS